MSTERPLASLEREKLALDVFPIHMTPGDYAVQHGDSAWGGFGYEKYCYRNERLDRWIQAVHKITTTPGLLARVKDRVV